MAQAGDRQAVLGHCECCSSWTCSCPTATGCRSTPGEHSSNAQPYPLPLRHVTLRLTWAGQLVATPALPLSISIPHFLPQL